MKTKNETKKKRPERDRLRNRVKGKKIRKKIFDSKLLGLEDAVAIIKSLKQLSNRMLTYRLGFCLSFSTTLLKYEFICTTKSRAG